MTLYEALYRYLCQDASVKPLVGTRIYPLVAPHGTPPPYLVVQTISGLSVPHMTGVADLRQETVQIACWGRVFREVIALGEHVRLALDGYYSASRGLMHGLDVRRILGGLVLDSNEYPDDGSQEMWFRRLLDFDIWFRED